MLMRINSLPCALSLLLATTPLASQTHSAAGFGAMGRVGFGSSIAVSGQEVFVGRNEVAPGFPVPAARAGGVHVFRRSGSGWVEAVTISGAGAVVGDGFGSVLAVAGDYLAVGAPTGGGGGAVYVFERRGEGWSQAARLTTPAPADSAARFGRAIALSGERLLIGAPGSGEAMGEVYLASRSGAGWGPPVRIATGVEPAGRFGAAVALLGDLALVGAPGDAPSGGLGAGRPQIKPGSATLYQLRGDGWGEAAKLRPDPDTTVMYGAAVLLGEGEALVSSPYAARATGRVYVFRPGAAGWALAERLRASAQTPGAFGGSLAMDGATLLVGAPAARSGTGDVFVFGREGSAWTERQILPGQAAGLGVLFGSSVGLAGEVAAVGGPMDAFFAGVGTVFARREGRWTEAARIGDAGDELPVVTGGEVRCADGKAAAFDCEQVDLLAFLPKSALGAERGIMINDLWGWTDPQSGREYAIVGRMDGTVFVDVTDPQQPRYLGQLPLHQGARTNLWRDMKVYQSHVFIVADNAGPHGVQVFDLTRLRNVRRPPETFTEDAHYDRIASAHNIVIDTTSGFAFTVGSSGGGETCGGALHMIDIRNPKQPAFAGCYADPATGRARTGYTHDAQCVTYGGPDEKYRGREICFNASETAVGIADVTDKRNPRSIAVGEYPNTGYTHQGWLSDDQRYFFVNDELDELAGNAPRTRTLVWDVSSLDEPVLAREFLGTTAASDHNLYVKGNHVFESNYVSGLRILDISDPRNPREVGYFDTVPLGENVPGFAGSWSNYPYFKSGTIVVTSMMEGLFILRHRPTQLSSRSAMTPLPPVRSLAALIGALGAAHAAPAAAQGARLYVTNQDDATVSVADLATHRVLETVDLQTLGFGPNAKPHHAQVEPDGSHWYLTLIGGNKVLKLDRQNRIVGSVDMEVPGLMALDPTSDLLVVGHSMSAVNPPRRLTVIRRSTMQKIDEYDVFFPRPHALVVDPRGGFAYAASLAENQVASMSLADGHLELVNIDGPPLTLTQFAVSPDGRWLVATAQTANQLIVFDLTTPGKPKLSRIVALEGGPFEPGFTPDGRLVFVTNLDGNAVSVIDPATWTVAEVIRHDAFRQPHGVATSPDGRYVYISNRFQAGGAHDHEGHKATGAGNVAAICIATRRVAAVMGVGHYAAGIGVAMAADLTAVTPPCG